MNKRVATKRGALPRYRSFHPGTQPEYNYPPYASTQKRCPTQPLVVAPQTLSELTGPIFGYGDIKPTDNDLTRQHRGEPIGERIMLHGRKLGTHLGVDLKTDEDRRMWQLLQGYEAMMDWIAVPNFLAAYR